MKRSFFPHPGNKFNVIRNILDIVPKEYNVYYEPFLGSGVVFLNLQPPQAILNDCDYFVYTAWKSLQEFPRETYDTTINLQQEYNILARIPHLKKNNIILLCDTLDTIQPNPIIESAHWIALKKISYNSIIYHEKGIIKKPTGKNKITLSKLNDFYHINTLLKRDIKIHCEDYLDILKSVKEKDFVYLDPPYLFSNIVYTQKEDNRGLYNSVYNEFKRLDSIGAYVLLSLEEHQEILKDYVDYTILKVRTWRPMSKKYVNELLIKNY